MTTLKTTKHRILGGFVAGVIALALTSWAPAGSDPVLVAGSAVANSILWGAVIVGVLR